MILLENQLKATPLIPPKKDDRYFLAIVKFFSNGRKGPNLYKTGQVLGQIIHQYLGNFSFTLLKDAEGFVLRFTPKRIRMIG